jgi:predicted Fe-Mo cluster-binding NifX family protein
MKIAAITDDGTLISQHFGRAANYLVVTVEDGKILGRDLRPKLGHTQLGGGDHATHDEPGHQHGFGPEEDERHGRMAEVISDCEAVLCRGMGRGAYESLQSRHIRPVVTDIANIDEAVLAYAQGHIVDHTEKLH